MIFVNGYLILWNKLIRNLNKLKEDCEYSLSTTDSETENFLIKKQNMLNISGRSGHIVNLTGGYMGGWTCLSKELFEEDFPITALGGDGCKCLREVIFITMVTIGQIKYVTLSVKSRLKSQNRIMR